MKLTVEALRTALLATADAIEQQKDELTDLDREIGDGDHGINMSRGFQGVKKELEVQNSLADLGELSKLVGMTLIKTVGGASGPLYGTAFVKFATKWSGMKSVEGEDLFAGFKEATEGIKSRGKSQAGQKTMVDIWEPFTASLQADSTLEEVIDQALVDTKDLVATKGRASYFGEATKGVQDPGALSSSILLKNIVEVLHD
ncbi:MULTISPECIES: dihydroxyacetone kinase subunit DhaL [Bacillaceae]|uniref:phosphoenolpyruvate--glycerone phosphotransferase n=1 Tax=Domibacillus aminovorans TaxID=29332 RepID=A0A177KIE7_9BACI|nr:MULTISPECIES: dihydroxyacetone kinase subunit DhaL [Bacillaceae]OAH53173.1 dihydroxyacetone kinase [Domibacillus aminovorans]OAH60256.1 dihydroxyacetone kinase [Domibacillus aminovorans]